MPAKIELAQPLPPEHTFSGGSLTYLRAMSWNFSSRLCNIRAKPVTSALVHPKQTQQGMTMNKLFVSTICLSILVGGLISLVFHPAQVLAAEAQETPPIVEAFSCSYHKGKEAADLDSAIDFWNEQLKKIGSPDLNAYFAATGMPLRASVDADFFWFGVYPNLNVMGRALSDYLASKPGQAADARFASMSSCRSNTYFSEALYEGMGEPQAEDTSAVLEMYACKLNEGKTMADVREAEDYWRSQVTAMKFPANFYRWSPFMANTPYDLVYVGVNDDLESYASANTTFLASAGGEEANRRFEAVMNCESGLLTSRIVHQPVES